MAAPQTPGVFERIFNSTLTLPQQLLWRTWRAAWDEDIDLFSEKGLADGALLPLIGIFDSHEHDVMPDEMFGKNFGAQLAGSILTDPTFFMGGAYGKAWGAAKGMKVAMGMKQSLKHAPIANALVAAAPKGKNLGQYLKTASTSEIHEHLSKFALQGGGELTKRQTKNLSKTLDMFKHIPDDKLARPFNEFVEQATKYQIAWGVPILQRFGMRYVPKNMEGYGGWIKYINDSSKFAASSVFNVLPVGGWAAKIPFASAVLDSTFGAFSQLKMGVRTGGATSHEISRLLFGTDEPTRAAKWASNSQTEFFDFLGNKDKFNKISEQIGGHFTQNIEKFMAKDEGFRTLFKNSGGDTKLLDSLYKLGDLQKTHDSLGAMKLSDRAAINKAFGKLEELDQRKLEKALLDPAIESGFGSQSFFGWGGGDDILRRLNPELAWEKDSGKTLWKLLKSGGGRTAAKNYQQGAHSGENTYIRELIGRALEQAHASTSVGRGVHTKQVFDDLFDTALVRRNAAVEALSGSSPYQATTIETAVGQLETTARKLRENAHPIAKSIQKGAFNFGQGVRKLYNLAFDTGTASGEYKAITDLLNENIASSGDRVKAFGEEIFKHAPTAAGEIGLQYDEFKQIMNLHLQGSMLPGEIDSVARYMKTGSLEDVQNALNVVENALNRVMHSLQGMEKVIGGFTGTPNHRMKKLWDLLDQEVFQYNLWADDAIGTVSRRKRLKLSMGQGIATADKVRKVLSGPQQELIARNPQAAGFLFQELHPEIWGDVIAKDRFVPDLSLAEVTDDELYRMVSHFEKNHEMVLVGDQRTQFLNAGLNLEGMDSTPIFDFLANHPLHAADPLVVQPGGKPAQLELGMSAEQFQRQTLDWEQLAAVVRTYEKGSKTTKAHGLRDIDSGEFLKTYDTWLEDTWSEGLKGGQAAWAKRVSTLPGQGNALLKPYGFQIRGEGGKYYILPELQLTHSGLIDSEFQRDVFYVLDQMASGGDWHPEFEKKLLGMVKGVWSKTGKTTKAPTLSTRGYDSAAEAMKAAHKFLKEVGPKGSAKTPKYPFPKGVADPQQRSKLKQWTASRQDIGNLIAWMKREKTPVIRGVTDELLGKDVQEGVSFYDALMGQGKYFDPDALHRHGAAAGKGIESLDDLALEDYGQLIKLADLRRTDSSGLYIPMEFVTERVSDISKPRSVRGASVAVEDAVRSTLNDMSAGIEVGRWATNYAHIAFLQNEIQQYVRGVEQSGATNKIGLGIPEEIIIELSEALGGLTRTQDEILHSSLGPTGKGIMDITQQMRREILTASESAGTTTPGSPLGYLSRILSRGPERRLNEIFSNVADSHKNIAERLSSRMPSNFARHTDHLTVEDLNDFYREIKQLDVKTNPDAAKFAAQIEEVFEDLKDVPGMKFRLDPKVLEEDPFVAVLNGLARSQQNIGLIKFFDDFLDAGVVKTKVDEVINSQLGTFTEYGTYGDFTITGKDLQRSLKTKEPVGEIRGSLSKDFLTINVTYPLPEFARGTGHGMGMYLTAIKEAKKRGLGFRSDSSVSNLAKGVYFKLMQRKDLKMTARYGGGIRGGGGGDLSALEVARIADLSPKEFIAQFGEGADNLVRFTIDADTLKNVDIKKLELDMTPARFAGNKATSPVVGGKVVGYYDDAEKVFQYAPNVVKVAGNSTDTLIDFEKSSEALSSRPKGLIIEASDGHQFMVDSAAVNHGHMSVYRMGQESYGINTPAKAMVNSIGRAELDKQLITKGDQIETLAQDMLGEYVMYGASGPITGAVKAAASTLEVTPAHWRTFDNINYMIKAWQTVYRLPFHIGNLASGVFQTGLAGASPVNTMAGYGDAMRVLYADPQWLRAWDTVLAGSNLPKIHSKGGFKLLPGTDVVKAIRRWGYRGAEKLPEAELRRLGLNGVTDHYIPNGRGGQTSVGELLSEMAKQSALGTFSHSGLRATQTGSDTILNMKIQALSPNFFKKFGMSIDKGMAKLGTTPGGGGIRELSEIINRLASVAALTRQGFSKQRAVQLMKNAHVSYDAITPFERNWMRRAFMYYTFPRKFMPWAAGKFSENPAKMSGIINTIRQDELFTMAEGRTALKLGDYRVDVGRLAANVEASTFMASFFDKLALPIGEKLRIQPYDAFRLEREMSTAGLLAPGGLAGALLPLRTVLPSRDHNQTGNYMDQAISMAYPIKYMAQAIGLTPTQSERSPYVQYTGMDKLITNTDFGLGVRKVRPNHEVFQAYHGFMNYYNKLKLQMMATPDPERREMLKDNVTELAKGLRGMITREGRTMFQ